MMLDKKEMIESGIHIGGISKKKNPLMREYILEKREKKRIFNFLDIGKTLSSCLKLKSYLEKIMSNNNSQILFLSTKKQTSELLINLAKENEMPYVVEKWKGGLLTNFDTIKLKIKGIADLKKRLENEKNNKNRTKMELEISKLEKIYGGISSIKQASSISAIFVIGKKTENAKIEARKMKIPVIAVCGIGSNPGLVDYVIPGNDYNTKSISFFLNYVFNLIKDIKKNNLQIEEKN